MAFTSVRISREELYRKVWAHPVSVVAKEYGISDVGLKKMCLRLDIPVPGLGYWAKKQHGKAVKQAPLPAPKAVTKLEVTIKPNRQVPADPAQLAKAGEIIEAEQLEVNAVRVPESLAASHPAVSRSLKLMSKTKPGPNGLIQLDDPACLPVTVSRNTCDRALRIMEALLQAFADRGYDIGLGNEGKCELTVVVADEPLTIYLEEDLTRTPRPLTPEQQRRLTTYGWKSRPEYDEAPSGKLSLHVNANLWNGMRRRWSDSERRPLENALNSFLAGIAKVAVAARGERLERERRAREFEERERRRKELMLAQEREKTRLSDLDRQVSSWHQAERIREFVAAVRMAHQERNGGIDPNSELGQYLTWASVQADRYDPLVKSPPSVLDEKLQ